MLSNPIRLFLYRSQSSISEINTGIDLEIDCADLGDGVEGGATGDRLGGSWHSRPTGPSSPSGQGTRREWQRLRAGAGLPVGRRERIPGGNTFGGRGGGDRAGTAVALSSDESVEGKVALSEREKSLAPGEETEKA